MDMSEKLKENLIADNTHQGIDEKKGFVIKSFKENNEFVGYLTYFDATGCNMFHSRIEEAYVFERKEDCIMSDGQTWELSRGGGKGYYKIEAEK